MIRTVGFVAPSTESLASKINKFLDNVDDGNFELLDVKFNTVDCGEDIANMALIVYQFETTDDKEMKEYIQDLKKYSEECRKSPHYREWLLEELKEFDTNK